MKHDIDKYVKEYNDNKCRFCAYYRKHGGRCYECENHNWFIQEISQLDFVIKRVTENSKKEFAASERAKEIKADIDLHKKMYDLFDEYVEKQKELLYEKISDLKEEYLLEMNNYVNNNTSKASELLKNSTNV